MISNAKSDIVDIILVSTFHRSKRGTLWFLDIPNTNLNNMQQLRIYLRVIYYFYLFFRSCSKNIAIFCIPRKAKSFFTESFELSWGIRILFYKRRRLLLHWGNILVQVNSAWVSDGGYHFRVERAHPRFVDFLLLVVTSHHLVLAVVVGESRVVDHCLLGLGNLGYSDFYHLYLVIAKVRISLHIVSSYQHVFESEIWVLWITKFNNYNIEITII